MPQSTDIRERILRVATRLFATHGYGSTSVRQIVEAAGVTKPTLYYWFKNKETLFEEIVQHHVDRVEQLLEEALAADTDTAGRLTGLVEAMFAGVRDEPDVVRLLMTAHHRPEEGQPTVDLLWLHMAKIEILERLFAEGIARGELRSDLSPNTLVMAFLGTVNLHMASRCRELAPTEPHHIVDLFLHGAGA